jgi:hypothetical protein
MVHANVCTYEELHADEMNALRKFMSFVVKQRIVSQ